MTYHIPKVAISVTSRRKTEIRQIVSKIKRVSPSGSINSIDIESFGNVEKVTAVVIVESKKIEMTYLFNKKTEEVKFVQEVPIPEIVTGGYYSEETNKFGETTIVSNNVEEITSKVTTVTSGIEYIQTKYPTITGKPVEMVEVVEYPESYKVNYVTKVDQTNSFAVVVEINKETKETVEISTYTQDDVKPDIVTKPSEPEVEETLPTESEEFTQIVEFLQESSEVEVKKIEKVTKVEKKTTIFGSEIVTIEAVTDKGENFETEVVFNPDTKDIVINEFEITDKKPITTEVATKFNVDVITGTKVTVTNNPTVLASSEITQEIIKKITSVDQKFETTEVISSATTEYPDKVMVVSLFKDIEKNEVTKVVSIFDKKTSEVKIV